MFSLRKVAGLAQVSPGALTSLAHLLDYVSYNAMRARFQQDETGVLDYFSAAGNSLRRINDTAELDGLIAKAVRTDILNIEALLDPKVIASIHVAAKLLHQGRRILIIGRRATFGLMHYLHHLVQLIRDDASFLDGQASIDIDRIAGVTADDVIVCCGFYPYVKEVVNLVGVAAKRGARVISITDSKTSPLGRLGKHAVVFRVANPWVIGSLAAGTVIVQALVAQLTVLGGTGVLPRLSARERALNEVGIFTR